MRTAVYLAMALAVASLPLGAQDGINDPQMRTPPPAASDDSRPPRPLVTREQRPADPVQLSAGTKIPLVLRQAISTKGAREGDPVYAETNFPVVMNGQVVVPTGTYVQGVISRSQRAGRVKGRAELLVHFTSLIFPSGYTVMLPGAVDQVPGSETNTMKDNKEGTVQGDSSKGKDAKTIATGAGVGAGLGTMVSRGGLKGVGVGGGLGAAAGLATVLLTRGPDVKLERGTNVEMILERDVVIDRAKAIRSAQMFRLQPNQ